MDPGTRTLISIALLLALNNAIVRLPFLHGRPLLFWAVQALDALAAGVLIWRGIPGFEEMPAIGWMLGLLLILHIAQNLRWLADQRREARVSDAADARRSALREALERTERDP